MAREPTTTTAVTAGKWLLAVIVPLSGLALGAIPTEVLMVASILAAASAALLWSSTVPDEKVSSSVPWLLVSAALLVGFTVLQAVPLPASLCRALSPATADVWARALSPLREPGPAWHSLSVAPGASWVQVLRGTFYACVFLAGVRVRMLENGQQFLVRVVVVSSSLMAFAALGHYAVGATSIFGIYRPTETLGYRAGRLAPLLNTNHLAAYVGLGACVAFGALFSRRWMPRAVSASLTVVLVGVALTPGSRGATAALVLGILLIVALTVRVQRHARPSSAAAQIAAVAGAVAVIVVAIALSDSRAHLLDRDLSRLDTAKQSLRLVTAAPWFGFGRGSFETVFSSVRVGTTYVTWTHPEDIFVQWAVEWGLPASVLGAAAALWALRPQVMLRSHRPAVALWVAVAATMLHEVADYHMEVPGMVALAALCVASVVGVDASRGGRKVGVGAGRVRTVAWVAAAASVGATVLVVPFVRHSLGEDRRALSVMAVDPTVPDDAFHQAARAAMLRFPAEPFIPLMGGVRAVARRENALPWVARALERSPRFGRAHFVLARALALRGGAAQARLEYRLAYEYDADLRGPITTEAIGLIDGPEAALELVPEGSIGVPLLEALVGALAPRLPSTAHQLDLELERRAPQSVAPLSRRAAAAVSDVLSNESWCVADPSCLSNAIDVSDEFVRRAPNQCQAHLLRAELKARAGKVGEVVTELGSAVERVDDRAVCQRRVVEFAIAHAQGRFADNLLEQLVRRGCGSKEECIDLYGWAASTQEARGRYLQAVRLYRRILSIMPEREDLLIRIGELGDRDGLRAEGVEAYATLAARHPEDPRWRARQQELANRAHGPP